MLILSSPYPLSASCSAGGREGEFDMRVKSCVASDGGGHTIQLSDEFGCVLRPKMISRFLKARGSDDRATVITYAFFHAFKFPDALSVHIKCKVGLSFLFSFLSLVAVIDTYSETGTRFERGLWGYGSRVVSLSEETLSGIQIKYYWWFTYEECRYT